MRSSRSLRASDGLRTFSSIMVSPEYTRHASSQFPSASDEFFFTFSKKS